MFPQETCPAVALPPNDDAFNLKYLLTLVRTHGASLNMKDEVRRFYFEVALLNVFAIEVVTNPAEAE